MILEEIRDQLETVDKNVFYGMVDESVKDLVWDYIVFNRTTLRASGNRTGYSDFYDVTIVRENFIPEGLDLEIIGKMLSIAGMREAGTDGEYNYILKPNTNIVVEALTLHFVRARK